MLEAAEFKHRKELERRNKSIIKSYWKGKWNERRPEILDELQTQDFVYYGTSMTLNGIEQYKEAYGKYLNESASSRVEIQDLIAEGDKVVSRTQVIYVPKEETSAMPFEHKEITVSIFTIFKLDHGKISEEWEIVDELGMMQQLGMELHRKETTE